MKRMKEDKTIRILVVEPGKHPRAETIPHTLEALQKVVGGDIQAIYPWDDPVVLVCDEEGLLKDYVLNRVVDQNTIIAGTFFICGLDEDDFADLSDELMEKYRERFYQPEMIINTPVGFMAIPICPMEED